MSAQQILSELTRVKVEFQLRAIKAAMGIPTASVSPETGKSASAEEASERERLSK